MINLISLFSTVDTLLIKTGKASLEISEQFTGKALYWHFSSYWTWVDETWNDVELAVPGYNLFRKDRKSNSQSRSCAGSKVIIYACDGP